MTVGDLNRSEAIEAIQALDKILDNEWSQPLADLRNDLSEALSKE